MARLWTAWRLFWRVLFDPDTASKASQILAPMDAPREQPPVRQLPVAPPPPTQNPALTLLATLQREARLIDFLQEDLQPYTDEQIGAAVREVHREAAQVLQRVLGLQPVVRSSEGEPIEVAAGFDAGRFRVTGRVSGSGPYRGTLRHHGWEATRCDLPTYTGSPSAATVIAPAEVEIT